MPDRYKTLRSTGAIHTHRSRRREPLQIILGNFISKYPGRWSSRGPNSGRWRSSPPDWSPDYGAFGTRSESNRHCRVLSVSERHVASPLVDSSPVEAVSTKINQKQISAPCPKNQWMNDQSMNQWDEFRIKNKRKLRKENILGSGRFRKAFWKEHYTHAKTINVSNRNPFDEYNQVRKF